MSCMSFSSQQLVYYGTSGQELVFLTTECGHNYIISHGNDLLFYKTLCILKQDFYHLINIVQNIDYPLFLY